MATDSTDTPTDQDPPQFAHPVAVVLDDAALAAARAAATDEAGDAALVGDPVDAYVEDAVAVTARFQARLAGYRGWLWSVTMALLDAEHPTVSEVVLLPGPDALTAPAWVPWEQRIRSGDLGVGDLLPAAPDDARLVPAYLQSDDPAVEEVAHELGIGRVRVLSPLGREDAAERWHTGAFGPADDMAVHAPGHCATCAFYLPLAGSLGLGFGACGNEYSPADGRVVDAGYGCGAHSEAIGAPTARAALTDTVVDELRLEVHARTAGEPAQEEAEADMTSADDADRMRHTDRSEDADRREDVDRSGGDGTPVADPTGLHWPDEDDDGTDEGPTVVLAPAATTAALAVEGVSEDVSDELDPDEDRDDDGGSSGDLARQQE
jgi:hypothetical protein